MNRSKWALLLAALLCIVQAVMPMTVFAFTAQTPTRVPEIGEAVTVYTKADMVLSAAIPSPLWIAAAQSSQAVFMGLPMS